MRTARWTPHHLARLAEAPATTAPTIGRALRALPYHDIWDSWPVQEEDGSTAVVDGAELWMALTAPAVGHPEQRHDRARIRLLARTADRWRDLGDVFPDGASPGSREWSGSAVRRLDGTVSVFYTAAGLRGESRTTFRQRVVEARARLGAVDGVVQFEPHVEHHVVLRGEGPYLPADEVEGGPGRIMAFRDPGRFRDPADGREYLLIAASVPWRGHFTGAVALAGATTAGWDLLPPLLVSAGVNHEIERPHMVVHQGRYYLFFCTSRQAFHPAGSAPTGLYGFVAPALTGPYEPLNGSGLVIQNPPAQPDQAYAWLVLPDRSVESFVNYLSTDGGDPRLAEPETARACFGGTAAPTLNLALHEAGTALLGA
ncbi:glycoside hydrolase family 68 protein [Kutzneria buriramensis]|uniref:glycoside hydrolase family 68 protein n=1 Tax=Kutzneria buriramensis TaxID=1045776 RepID=UPI0024825BC0|nr:glycoside hydrolase family 68 protein [Kutzneria buriramensis]